MPVEVVAWIPPEAALSGLESETDWGGVGIQRDKELNWRSAGIPGMARWNWDEQGRSCVPCACGREGKRGLGTS